VNRINPLYIGALLVVLLILSIYLQNSAESELLEAKESYKQTQKIADELSGLKVAYANKRQSERSLKRLLSQSILKSAKLTASYKKSSADISSKSIDKKALDYLMGKLLNSTYDIRKMKIKRLSEQKATLELEIRW